MSNNVFSCFSISQKTIKLKFFYTSDLITKFLQLLKKNSNNASSTSQNNNLSKNIVLNININ